jgi:NDP-sugar pyrophosphorylase family protein
MRRTRLTITLKNTIVGELDQLTDGDKIRNRSHAIEYILSEYFKPSIITAIILAGGKGENLRPYTYELPKSLLPIKSRPILEYIIENLRRAEIRNIIICIGYLGEKIKEYFADGKKWGVKIQYSEEKYPLGTGGAIFRASQYVKNQSFILIHGDVLTDLNLKDLINFHKEQQSIGTIALTLVKNPSLFGQLKLHGVKIVNFYSPTKKGQEQSYLINTGVYVFNKEIFNFFPKNKQIFMLEDLLDKLIKEKKLSGFVFEKQWFDVGTLDNYEEAIKKYNPKI